MPLRKRPFCMRSDACPSVDDAENVAVNTTDATKTCCCRRRQQRCTPSLLQSHHSTSHTPPQTLWSSASVGNHFNQNWISLRLLVIGSKQYLRYAWCNHQPTFHRLAISLITLAFPRKSQTTHSFISPSYTGGIATLDSQVPTSLC